MEQLNELKKFLGAASGAEMADVEQMQKMIPFFTCEVSLYQCVSELVFGVNVFDLDLRVQIDSIKQPIKSNSVSSGDVSHCWTPAFDHHFDYRLIVLQDIQHSTRTRMRCI